MGSHQEWKGRDFLAVPQLALPEARVLYLGQDQCHHLTLCDNLQTLPLFSPSGYPSCASLCAHMFSITANIRVPATDVLFTYPIFPVAQSWFNYKFNDSVCSSVHRGYFGIATLLDASVS